MSNAVHMRRKGSGRTRRDEESRPHGPLCLWRYLAAYCVVAVVWIVIVYQMAVVNKERAKYGSALLYLSLGFACFAYLAEEAYVWWKEQRGVAGPGDYTDPGTKKWMLGAVVVFGGCLTFGITRAMVQHACVWTPEHGMNPPHANDGGGPGESPFDPTAPRPLATTPPAASDVPGLVAYWSFDENAGAKAADTGGGAMHATLRGSRWVPGVRGSALWITGPTDAIQLGDGRALNFPRGGPFTFTGWIRTTNDGIVLSLRDSGEPGADIMISVENGRLFFLAREDRGEAGVPAQVTGASVVDGNWHHFAATRDTSGQIELFVDGVSAGVHQTDQSDGPITTDLRFVGREEYRIRVSFPAATTWNGVIDELAAFGRQLTSDEIARLAGRR